MKLPLQAPAVMRDGLAWPSGRFARQGGAAPGVEPAACQICGAGPNPCSGGFPTFVQCNSTGTCQCCPSGQKANPMGGGQCGCKP